MLSFSSYKHASIYYIVVAGILLSGFLSYVAAPHRQEIEITQVQLVNSDSPLIDNRKFSEFTNAYTPEITEYLTAPRSGWLPLWSNNTELGRPLYQISGFSSAYLPTWVITRWVDEPWRFITTLSLGFCFLAGLFIMFSGFFERSRFYWIGQYDLDAR